MVTDLRERVARLEADDYRPFPRLPTLPWAPHEGPPHMDPQKALDLYRAKRSAALARNALALEAKGD
jgi:hypothetical protein